MLRRDGAQPKADSKGSRSAAVSIQMSDVSLPALKRVVCDDETR